MNNTAQQYINQNLTDKQPKIINLLANGEKFSKYYLENFAEDGTVAVEGKLTRELTLQDYPQLEEINLSNHQLTSLTIINCPQLKEINVRNNQLTKLEISGANQISQIIAGQNQLESLDLTNCPNLKKLMLPDNPLLTEIKGLNLTILKEINLTNTLVNLGAEIEALKEKNQSLKEALSKFEEAAFEGKLKLAETIQTPKQAEEAIQRLLKKVEREWRNFFETGQDPALEVMLKNPERRKKAKEILKWVIEAQVNRDYQGLAEKWSGSSDYKVENDFDGNLDMLFQLLRVRNYPHKMEVK